VDSEEREYENMLDYKSFLDSCMTRLYANLSERLVAMKTHTDMALCDYLECRVASFAGGATWLNTPWNAWFVVPIMTPVEIDRFYQKHPLDTVRAEIIRYIAGPFDLVKNDKDTCKQCGRLACEHGEGEAEPNHTFVE
jgi:hypothetical protein